MTIIYIYDGLVYQHHKHTMTMQFIDYVGDIDTATIVVSFPIFFWNPK